MKQYWANLQPRERHTLLAGTIVLVLILLYALVLDPFSQELTRLQQSVKTQEEGLAWMQQASAEIKRLRASSPGARSLSGQSLMSLIDASARSTGLSGSIKQLKPEGGGVKVRLEGVAFDDMLRWLEQLQRKYAVSVSTLVMERLAEPGRVNASVALGSVSG